MRNFRLKPLFIIAGMCLFLLTISCNDPTNVGEEIIDSGSLEFEVKDDFEFKVRQLGPRRLLFHNPLTTVVPASHLYIGNIEDENFGKRSSAGFIQFLPNSISAIQEENPIVDSVVMTLYYDSLAFYGARGSVQNVEVFRIVEEIPVTAQYYTNDEFDFFPTALATQSTYPQPGERVFLGSQDTVGLAPHLRIKLPSNLGSEILNYTTDQLNTASEFTELFRGLYVRASNFDSELMAFNIFDNTTVTNENTGVTIFYRVGDDAKTLELVPFNVSSVTVQNYDFDISGSNLEKTIAGDSTSYFIHGNGLARVAFEIEGLTDLQDILVNKANIEIPIDHTVDYSDFSSTRRLGLYQRDITGLLRLVDEPALGVVDTITKDPLHLAYTFNIPATLQRIIDGRVFDPELYLVPLPELTNPTGSILIGKGDPIRKMKLSLTYSKLK